MAIKLTKRILDTAQLKNKAYEVWDIEIKGLHVIVTPTGRKTFYFRYYDANRKNQRLKIGVFGIVPLNEPAKKVLKEIERKPENPYVFCSAKHKHGHLVNIQKAWQSIRKKADLIDVRIHDLRHSFASFAIKQGLDLYQIAKLLGHKNIRTIMRYAHLAKEDLIKASNVVGQVFIT